MKCLDEDVSRLVTGKSPRYLFNATLLLVGAMTVLVGLLSVVEATYAQNTEYFDANDNVHFIAVTPVPAAGADTRLAFRDADRVAQLAAQHTPTSAVNTVLRTGYGMSGPHGEDYFLTGLAGPGGRLVGLPALRAGTAYSTDAKRDPLVLQVPRVHVTHGGLASASRSDFRLRREGGLRNDSPLFVLNHVDSASLIVSERTFADVVTHSYGMSWDQIKRRNDAGDSLGIDLISAIYVYVPDLDAVRPIATQLERAGYATSYTFKALDDLPASLDRLLVLGIIAALVVTGVSIFLGLVNLNTYFRLAHRDLGILKHLGFSRRRVARIYAARVRVVSVRVIAMSMVSAGFIGGFALREDVLSYGALNAMIVVGCVGTVHLVATGLLLKRHVCVDTLSLLKLDREFD